METSTSQELELAALRRRIEMLELVCEERKSLIDRLNAEADSLRRIAEERGVLLVSNDAQFRAREAELQAAAEQRAVLLADLTAAFEAKVREIERLRGNVAG